MNPWRELLVVIVAIAAIMVAVTLSVLAIGRAALG